jgi:signal transduction histidine kinase
VLSSVTRLRGPWAGGQKWEESLLFDVVRLIVLVVVLVNVPLAQPGIGTGAQGIALAVALGASAVTYIVWMLARRSEQVWLVSLIVMAASGGVLAGLSPQTTAVAIGCVATSSAGARLETRKSLAITMMTVAAYLSTGLATGAPWQALLGYSLTFTGLWAFGFTRHAFLLRACEAERALAEARRAHAAENEAAALAERARIAREIHDVLAHSLAAVSVNLEAAEGLLGSLPDGSPELAKAMECVSRAGALTKDGMAEARRAISALRDNADPLPDQLSALATEYSADGNVPVEFSVTGAPRPVAAEAGLAAYRTAQEALTNARKHAPGQRVSLSLEYSRAGIAVRVVNSLPLAPVGGPLAEAGAGHGLAGLRERAALSGGTLTAGPSGTDWQVQMRIPA